MNSAKLRVHVAPLGDNAELIVKPALSSKADKIWLLVGDSHQDNDTAHIEQITKKVSKSRIPVEVQYHNKNDVPGIIKSVKEIIQVEKGNEVYLNMTSGTHIQAAGIYSASAIYNEDGNVHPYCCDSNSGHDTSESKNSVRQIRPIQIMIPEKRLRDALVIIVNKGKISKSELGDLLHRYGIINPNPAAGNELQVTMSYMNQNIIIPLEKKWGLITTVKVGRKWWVLPTENGKTAAVYFADKVENPISNGISANATMGDIRN